MKKPSDLKLQVELFKEKYLGGFIAKIYKLWQDGIKSCTV